jgi:hypothetical protein
MTKTRLLPILISMLLLCAAALAQTQDEPTETAPANGGDFSINPQPTKVPKDVILVKGAVPSASDSQTPLPESGRIVENVYNNPYFSLSYLLPQGWRQKYTGPPPSDHGYYVLTQIEPGSEFKGPNPGTILISAQDLFFTPVPAENALSLIRFKKSRLSGDFKLERGPEEVKIASHSFVRFDYMSPVAELHWYTLATEIRCHEVEFLLTSRDTQLLDSLVQSMDGMQLPGDAGPSAGHGGGAHPVCVKNYASGDNVLQRVEPVLTGHKFNPVPVRIIIDKYGKVKHVHVISAFSDQSKAITDALLQWEFRPYRMNGEPVEVETGIMFGSTPQPRKLQANTGVAE